MADFPFQIVGFDLDGTLVDSNRDLTPAPWPGRMESATK